MINTNFFQPETGCWAILALLFLGLKPCSLVTVSVSKCLAITLKMQVCVTPYIFWIKIRSEKKEICQILTLN
jgi:hypothetical protein